MKESKECEDCGRPIQHGAAGRHAWHRRCRACHLKSIGDETPLRVWSRETGVSLKQLADDTEVPYRTVQRAAAGSRIEYEAAERLSQRTSLDIAVLCRGVADA